MASDVAISRPCGEAGSPPLAGLSCSKASDRDKLTIAQVLADSVTFIDISKRFATPSGDVNALININLSIRRGEVFGFIGRSGAGKSTLIRLINRLEKPTLGNVTINGISTSSLSSEGLVHLRRGIGMIFQHFNLMSAKTVAQNIALPLVMAGIHKQQIERKVSDLLALVSLSDKRDSYPAQLSGGQKQRVGIARALVHDPDILLCDEATSALDPENTRSILELLREINRRNGITVVLITHEMSVIREICDRVAVLDQGGIVESGDVWKVFGSPQHEVTRSLLGQLDHAIPDDLIAHLQPGYPLEEGRLLVRATFHPDSGSPPDLQAILQVLNGPVQLLDSAVNRISGHTFGRLLVAVPSRGNSSPDVERRLSGLPFKVDLEVIGHVTTNA